MQSGQTMSESYQKFLAETKPCERCNKRFKARVEGKPQKFCSPFCRLAHNQDKVRKPPVPERPCEACSAMFRPRQSTGRLPRWCSAECRRDGKKKPIATKQCRICSAPFETSRGNQVLCGEECAKKNKGWLAIEVYARIRQRFRALHEGARGWTATRAQSAQPRQLQVKPLLVECLWCGDDFEAIPGDMYCSEDCQADDAVERMKEAS